MEPFAVRNRLSKFRFSLEANTLTASVFLPERSRRKPRIFYSQVEDKPLNPVPEELNISYQNLINKQFNPRTFRRLMGLYLDLENIIVEEKATAEIAEEVRKNPNKRFSTRSFCTGVPQSDGQDAPQQLSTVSIMGTTRLPGTDLPSVTQSTSRMALNSMPSRQETSERSLDWMELSTLTDAQIQELVQRKMKKLDRFNLFLEKKDLKVEGLSMLMSPAHLAALARFQVRCRELLMRRKSLLAIRMNDAFEQKKSYMSLKKSLKNFQDQQNEVSRLLQDSGY